MDQFYFEPQKCLSVYPSVNFFDQTTQACLNTVYSCYSPLGKCFKNKQILGDKSKSHVVLFYTF